MAFNPDSVQFGPMKYTIITAHWKSGAQTCVVHFEDHHGNRYKTQALGISTQEQRQAVVDWALEQVKKGQHN